MNILASTSFIGDTGYNNHARSFFSALNKYHNVKIRNYTVGKTWKGYSQLCHDKEPYMTNEMRKMLILQTLHNSDGTISDYTLYNYQNDFKHDVHIILNDVNHNYFYEEKKGYTIGYNVWETTKYPDNFYNQILKFDEFWVPSEWQKEQLINQGYPKNKIVVIPEGVDIETFKPAQTKSKKYFQFLLFGRWEYRKSTTEIIKTFNNVFSNNDNVKLILSADNPYANDNLKSTEERITFYNLQNKNIEILHFPERRKYIDYLQQGDVFLSCARSEGWNLPLIEAMSCGTPSIYSNWGAQLEFAKNKGIPINVKHEVPAKNQNETFTGNYIEPDFDDLGKKMLEVYNNYSEYKKKALEDSKIIMKDFQWDNAAIKASEALNNKLNFAFVTCCNEKYMPIVEKLIQSINEFSKAKIILYGIDCEIPFDYPCLIKRRISPPKHSQHDKWYWKQYACIQSLDENFNNYVWIDGDAIVNYNIDDINKYFDQIENYPISDIHRNEEFYSYYYNNDLKFLQSFNENLCQYLNLKRSWPMMHVCLYIYNKNCKWWFEEIISLYKNTDLKNYDKLFTWNDEGIDNALRWKYNYKKHLPLSNFDTSGYDGDLGQTNSSLRDFYDFWNLEGPNNFNRVFGFQYIPENKSDILYFHGNKDLKISDEMIDFIKNKRDNSFHSTEKFFITSNSIKNLGYIKNIEGGTVEIANKYGWDYAIYHEIYNLQDYYLNREKRINNGDIVVDLGANIGIFNRWAYSQGASKVISFEPDKRYYELLSLNADKRSILFNAAVSNTVGETYLNESEHLGGSSIMVELPKKYKTRTYTLDYLFESKLIDHIDFLKIDVEGAEHYVFEGLSDENLKKIKYITMEYHHGCFNYNEKIREDLIKRLNGLGFNSYLLFLGSDTNLQYIYFYK
jgi:FkbM family methyltransferase